MIFDARILAMRIKKQRNKRNMTQEHLAEIANLSVVFISNVERAKRVPSLEKMIDIYKIYFNYWGFYSKIQF